MIYQIYKTNFVVAVVLGKKFEGIVLKFPNILQNAMHLNKYITIKKDLDPNFSEMYLLGKIPSCFKENIHFKGKQFSNDVIFSRFSFCLC